MPIRLPLIYFLHKLLIVTYLYTGSGLQSRHKHSISLPFITKISLWQSMKGAKSGISYTLLIFIMWFSLLPFTVYFQHILSSLIFFYFRCHSAINWIRAHRTESNKSQIFIKPSMTVMMPVTVSRSRSMTAQEFTEWQWYLGVDVKREWAVSMYIQTVDL